MSMIYFIENIETKHIKIGFTTNVKHRLGQLQTSSPHELRVLSVCEGDDKYEKELHSRFNESRLKGEWFNPDKELLDHIKSLEPYQSISKKYDGITRLRKDKHLSMEDVGKKLKITKQAVSDIEKRFEYDTITIKSLKEYLNAIGYDMTIVFSPK
jgi:ribosome-binding protein aMBF1 (putative translation factor)